MDAHYSSAYYGQGESKFLPRMERLLHVLNRRRAKRLMDYLRGTDAASPRVLDVGCGRALLLESIARSGAECHGLEREGFDTSRVSSKITMHHGTVNSLGFMPGSFQLIILWHVLEHLENPGEVLQQLADLLSPGGLLAVAVPNIDSLQAGWFGPDWFHLDLPRHLWHFTPKTLEMLWRAAGLKKVRASGLAAEQELFGFVQSLFNRLLPGAPNRLYKAMQGDARYNLLAWLAGAFCLIPLALPASLMAVAVGRGATHIVYLRKPD